MTPNLEQLARETAQRVYMEAEDVSPSNEQIDAMVPEILSALRTVRDDALKEVGNKLPVPRGKPRYQREKGYATAILDVQHLLESLAAKQRSEEEK